MNKLIVYTDGGSRGNPGPSGIGAVIKNVKGKILCEISEYIGETTNNQAEYKALLAAIKKAKEFNPDEIDFFLDSELVVKQLNREYKVKNKNLQPLFVEIYNNSLNFKKITYNHVRREFNKEADKLANDAMDKGQ
ncbi:ribonuclease HI family protein [Candidatus Parcubacteria bacterium]|nr:ribonuclease HI family protein [Candidatus Parcubacteria bacterium]